MPSKSPRNIPAGDPRLLGLEPSRTYRWDVIRAITGLSDTALRSLRQKGGLKPKKAGGCQWASGADVIAAIDAVDRSANETN